MWGSRRATSARSGSKQLKFESLEARVVMSAAPPAFEAFDVVEVASVEPIDDTSAAMLTTEEWVRSLHYSQFGLLTTQTVPYLTTAQVASIPSPAAFGLMSAAARGALNVAQVRALNVAATGVDLLTPQQKTALTATQIQSLPFIYFGDLLPNQIPVLTIAQTASIPHSGYLDSWPAASRAALTAAQVQSLNIETFELRYLSPQQVGWLTPAQVREVKFYEFHQLHPVQTPWLTIAQIQTIPHEGYFDNWPAASRAALTAPQVQALKISTIGIGALTAQQIGWLTAGQIQAVKFYEFARLAPSQIPTLTAAQIQSIPDAGYFQGLSTAARAALTTGQVRSLNVAALGLGGLTNAQIAWLTQSQVQSLDISMSGIGRLAAAQIPWLMPSQVRDVAYHELYRLQPWQIQLLSLEQVASIPHSGFVESWTAEARAALTLQQVQTLRIATFELEYLTAQQIAWLTPAQVREARFYELHLLNPAQIPWLTTTQIAAVPHAGYFSRWSAPARAALSVAQVQAMRPMAIGSGVLTTQQMGWLTAAQVQSLPFHMFYLLSPAQIPFLTTAQVASIPHSGYLEAWSTAARGALTRAQVQALNLAQIELRVLTDPQISWLTTPQIRQVKYYDFPRLAVWQIPLLTPAQVATVPNGYFILDLPDEYQKALTRDQLLALPLKSLAQVTHQNILPPAHYHDALSNLPDQYGVPTNEHMDDEAERIFALVPREAATHQTIASGAWSDPRIWRNGVVPAAGAKVLIAAGTTVQFDAVMNAAVHTLRIDGTLTFATDRNTQLKADTIVVFSTGQLAIGTAANPIRDHVTARVLIADGGPINRAWDPYGFSRGLISRGRVQMHGRQVAPYVAAAVDPKAGDTVLTLAQIPATWRVGDRLVISGTDPFAPQFGMEERTIRAIAGNTVTVGALFNHHASPGGVGVGVHIANVTRNIVFEAEDPSVAAERPHIMFLHANVDMANVALHGFGRTDKSVPINDPVVANGVLQANTGTNGRARYTIHFHHTGVNPAHAAAKVRGSVVYDSPGWGFVNHSSHVDFEDNVAVGVYGASFVGEDGNEIGSMRRNLSISAHGDANPATGSTDRTEARILLHDFGYQGNGFWFQGPGIKTEANISAGSRGSGFVYFLSSTKSLFDAVNMDDPALAAGQVAIPVGNVPIKQFDGNTAHTAPVGLEIWRHMISMPGGEGVIDNFTAWNTYSAGVDVLYSGNLSIRNATLIGNLDRFAGHGVRTNFLTHDVNFYDVTALGFDVGIDVPVRGASVVSGGLIAAARGLYVEKGHDTLRSVEIFGARFSDATPMQLGGRTQHDVYATGHYSFDAFQARRVESLFAEDRVFYTPLDGTRLRIHYAEQGPLYIPFPAATSAGFVPDDYLGKTNQQLWQTYGVVFGGRLLSAGVVGSAGIYGVVTPGWRTAS